MNNQAQAGYGLDYNKLGVRIAPAVPFVPLTFANTGGVKNVVGQSGVQATQHPVSPSGNVQSSTSVGYDSGIGWWIGFDKGTPKLFIGNSDGNKLTWDGSTLTIDGNFVIGGLVVTIGPTDDIQTALDLLNTNGGGTLYMKAGTYTVSSALTGYSSVRIVGVSPSQTIIYFNGTSANLSFMGTDIYTTGTITSITSGTAVVGSGTAWSTNASAGQGFFIGTRWYTIASVTDDTHLTLAEAYGDDITFPGASYRIATIIKDFSISTLTLTGSTGTGLVVQDARQYNINDVFSIQNNKGYSASYVSEQAINQMLNGSNTSDGANLTSIGLCQIQSFNNIGNGGNGITANNIKTIQIAASAFDSNTGDGMNITSGVGLVVTGESSGNGGNGITMVSGCDDNDFSEMTIEGNTGDGIKLTATSTTSSIEFCSIIGNGGYGVNIAASSVDSEIILGNHFASNTSGAVSDSGTSHLNS